MGVETQEEKLYKTEVSGSSLAAQWLGFWAFIAVIQVQPLVKELRSYKLCGTTNKQKNRTRIFRELACSGETHTHYKDMNSGVRSFGICQTDSCLRLDCTVY